MDRLPGLGGDFGQAVKTRRGAMRAGAEPGGIPSGNRNDKEKHSENDKDDDNDYIYIITMLIVTMKMIVIY